MTVTARPVRCRLAVFSMNRIFLVARRWVGRVQWQVPFQVGLDVWERWTLRRIRVPATLHQRISIDTDQQNQASCFDYIPDSSAPLYVLLLGIITSHRSLWSGEFVCYLCRRRRLCFHFGLFVCLSVCLSVRRITEKVVNGFWWNFLEG